jgi:uncharacterized protein (UPF0371 family)
VVKKVNTKGYFGFVGGYLEKFEKFPMWNLTMHG